MNKSNRFDGEASNHRLFQSFGGANPESCSTCRTKTGAMDRLTCFRGTVGAEQGTLVIFAGGDAQTIQDLSLIYNILSQRVTCMGNIGTGQATKICNQLIVAANSTLIAEAVALAAKAGVDIALLAPALAGGFADSKPFQILSPRMATHLFEPVQWKVQTLSKDLNNVVQLAAQHQLDIPVAARALQQLQAHQQQGYAEADLASVILQVEQKPNKIRRKS